MVVLSSSSDEYDAIPPNEHDMMLPDINEAALQQFGEANGIPNLSAGEFPSPAFPAGGLIHNANHRLMVCLVCQRANVPTALSLRVWFLVDTGSNATFLAKKTIDALANSDSTPSSIRIAIQEPTCVVEGYLSPPDKHFPDANVLGMQALLKLEVSISLNRRHLSFRLVKE